MSFYKNNPYGYRIFTKVVFFDFGAEYLRGQSCDLESVHTKFMDFKLYQN